MAVKIGSGDDNPATDSCCVADKVVCGILHHCSAWTFYLLGSVVLATAVLSFLMQQSQGIEALQMLIGGFVIFMIPQVVGGVVVGRTKDQILSERKDLYIGQYRIILSADTASEVPQPPERCLSRQAGIVRCCHSTVMREPFQVSCRDAVN